MKKVLLFSILVLFLTASNLSAQVFKEVDPVICPVDHNSYDTFVPPPKGFKQSTTSRTANNANITVNYNGFTEEAKVAYQYAVDIWASLLDSPVEIIVNANFTNLGQGVLGSAGPGTYVANFPGAVTPDTFYPIALAEKMAGRNINEGEADINSNFNSGFDFYFGLDGNPPSDQYDFVSIVLHELGHGLGFTGGVRYDDANSTGNWSLSAGDIPSIYSQFVELGDGSAFLDIPNRSVEVGNALKSGNLFFNGPITVSALEEPAQLYAPSEWNGGSSYSHLDENKFPAGDPNSLMSPQFGAGEAIHDPGVSLDIFADMGWVHTYLTHENTEQISKNFTEPFTIDLSVTSDTTYNELTPTLIYSIDGFETTSSIEMTDSGDGIHFSANIPNPGVVSRIQYYFEGVQDGTGRNYVSPAQAPSDYYDINILAIPDKPVSYLLTDGGDFESNQNDFSSYALTGDTNFWEYGQPSNTLNEAVSGNNVWKTKLNENVGIPNKTSSSALVSPTFDFTDNTKNHELSFSFLMENAYTSALFRFGPFGLQVQYSVDEGQTWELLGDLEDQRGENWYNVEESDPTVFPIDKNAGWIQQTIEVINGDTTFIPVNPKYNVSFLTGNDKVNFRFVFFVRESFPDQGYDADGVLIDDFQIVKSNPTADFITTAGDLVFPGDEVSFEYISTGANSFSWDFGDGNTSSVQNPTHVYEDGGFYDVSLTITSADGTNTVIKEELITVIPTRQISFNLEDGADLEDGGRNFVIQNISGTGFEIGQSTIEGKAGTASGSNAFVTGINAEVYQDNSEAYVYTPAFDFESVGSYELSFETNYSFEDNWDGFIVEYTLDGGETWLKLNNEVAPGWYNQISNAESIFGNQVPIFSGNTNNQFERKHTDISFLGGLGVVNFRIKFLSDQAEVDAGMAIDNIVLTGPDPGPAIPNFTSESTEGCAGSEIVFENESLGSISSMDWDFGEGATPRTATGPGPHSVVFNNAGNYTVSLTAVDFTGAEIIEEKVNYINISSNHTPTISAGERTEDFTVLLTASEGDSYQWFLAGDSIPGATERAYLAEEQGFYSVAVKIESCVGFSNSNNVITSNDSPLTRSFTAFPNPLKDNKELNISFENEYIGKYHVEIYSLNGRKIFSQHFNKHAQKEENAISLNNTEKGLYLVRVSTGKQSTQMKIVIE
ncbi:PKD domain-containing protein [Marivirga sp.]|uniref:PKD domain-containing protein n=1 Tax=Marivirga sp. TaxID=2018662 RepID=UPI002D802148|nr:PKD domain-containing protein [Marivirga sp.]HET8859829.1 PKD domain-containing protein [Marivirga sp.]